MAGYELSFKISAGNFLLTTLTNSLLIFLTSAYSKKIYGTYKSMILTFSTLGIIFASWELVSMPFMHTYNKSFLFFSLNTWLGASKEFLQLSIVFYTAVYMYILGFLTIQFVYRYLSLFQPKMAEKFEGKGVIIWMGYPIIPAALYGSAICIFCYPDKFTDDYLRDVVLTTYSRPIEEIPRFAMAPYAADGSLRKNVGYYVVGISVLASHYCAILFFGFKMHFYMKKKMEFFSNTNKKLQVQFFRALVAQTLVPTLLFVVPLAPLLLVPVFAPLLNFEISFQSGWFCCIFSFYPPIDSIVFMFIVCEYKEIIKKLLTRKLKVGNYSSSNPVDLSSSQPPQN